MSTNIRTMCQTAMFAVLLMLGAWITVPTAIPFTMQTLVLYAMIWLLDGKSMLSAVALYVLLGVVGVPVFAGFQGGVGALFGATGGYLFGFVAMALLRCLPHPAKGETAFCTTVAVIGTAVSYIAATVWYAFIFTGMSVAGLWAAFLTCVVPFILPDFAKGVVAAVVAGRIRRHIVW